MVSPELQILFDTAQAREGQLADMRAADLAEQRELALSAIPHYREQSEVCDRVEAILGVVGVREVTTKQGVETMLQTSTSNLIPLGEIDGNNHAFAAVVVTRELDEAVGRKGRRSVVPYTPGETMSFGVGLGVGTSDRAHVNQVEELAAFNSRDVSLHRNLLERGNYGEIAQSAAFTLDTMVAELSDIVSILAIVEPIRK